MLKKDERHSNKKYGNRIMENECTKAENLFKLDGW